MKTGSIIAVYFIIWWFCLFLVLPWGIRNASETGDKVEQGNEPGAPINPRIWRKFAATTVLATIVFGLVYGNYTQGWIGFEDIPLIGGPLRAN